jgi:hypothetical protein
MKVAVLNIAAFPLVAFLAFFSLCLFGIGFDTESTEPIFRAGSRVMD